MNQLLETPEFPRSVPDAIEGAVEVPAELAKAVDDSFEPAPRDAAPTQEDAEHSAEAGDPDLERIDVLGRTAKMVGKTALGSRVGRMYAKLGVHAAAAPSKVIHATVSAVSKLNNKLPSREQDESKAKKHGVVPAMAFGAAGVALGAVGYMASRHGIDVPMPKGTTGHDAASQALNHVQPKGDGQLKAQLMASQTKLPNADHLRFMPIKRGEGMDHYLTRIGITDIDERHKMITSAGLRSQSHGDLYNAGVYRGPGDLAGHHVSGLNRAGVAPNEHTQQAIKDMHEQLHTPHGGGTGGTSGTAGGGHVHHEPTGPTHHPETPAKTSKPAPVAPPKHGGPSFLESYFDSFDRDNLTAAGMGAGAGFMGYALGETSSYALDPNRQPSRRDLINVLAPIVGGAAFGFGASLMLDGVLLHATEGAVGLAGGAYVGRKTVKSNARRATRPPRQPRTPRNTTSETAPEPVVPEGERRSFPARRRPDWATPTPPESVPPLFGGRSPESVSETRSPLVAPRLRFADEPQPAPAPPSVAPERPSFARPPAAPEARTAAAADDELDVPEFLRPGFGSSEAEQTGVVPVQSPPSTDGEGNVARTGKWVAGDNHPGNNAPAEQPANLKLDPFVVEANNYVLGPDGTEKLIAWAADMAQEMRQTPPAERGSIGLRASSYVDNLFRGALFENTPERIARIFQSLNVGNTVTVGQNGVHVKNVEGFLNGLAAHVDTQS